MFFRNNSTSQNKANSIKNIEKQIKTYWERNIKTTSNSRNSYFERQSKCSSSTTTKSNLDHHCGGDDGDDKMFIISANVFETISSSLNFTLFSGLVLSKIDFQARFQKLILGKGTTILTPLCYRIFPSTTIATNTVVGDETDALKLVLESLGILPEVVESMTLLIGDGGDEGAACEKYLNSFLQWRFGELKKMNRIQFKKRALIYSPTDDGPVSEVNRSIGESAIPIQSLLLKMYLKKPFPHFLQPFSNRKIYLGAQLIHPELVFGITNCWVLPEEQFGVFQLTSDRNELIICSFSAARNLSFQGKTTERGICTPLLTFSGESLVGLSVQFSGLPYDSIDILSSGTCKFTRRGSGVYTSTPSDNPTDFKLLYQTKEHMDIHPTPIINIPKIGNMLGRHLYQNNGISMRHFPEDQIQSHLNDGIFENGEIIWELIGKNNLPKRRDRNYSKTNENTNVVLILQDYPILTVDEDEYTNDLSNKLMRKLRGRENKVIDMRPHIKTWMLNLDLALPYWEPSSIVKDRKHGEECVVSMCSSGYINYGSEEWRDGVKSHIHKNLKLLPIDEKYRHFLLQSVDWYQFNTFSIDTKGEENDLFWDELLRRYQIQKLKFNANISATFLIVYKMLRQMNILPEELCGEWWSFVLERMDLSACSSSILASSLQNSKSPLWESAREIRKVLQNHQTTHVKFGQPNLIHAENISLHEYIYLNPSMAPNRLSLVSQIRSRMRMSKKCSKPPTIIQLTEKFGCDASRLTYCDSGDSIDGFHYSEDLPNSIILKLSSFMEMVQEIVNGSDEDVSISNTNFGMYENILHSQLCKYVNGTLDGYQNLKYRQVYVNGWVLMQKSLSDYLWRIEILKQTMNRQLVLKFIEIQLVIISPVIPHISEYIWMEIMKHENSIREESWPSTTDIELSFKCYNEISIPRQYYLNCDDYINNVCRPIRKQIGKMKIKKAATVVIYIADKYLAWQLECLQILREFKHSIEEQDKQVMKMIRDRLDKSNLKRSMQFIQHKIEEYNRMGDDVWDPSALERNEEYLMAQNNIELFQKSISSSDQPNVIESVTVYKISELNVEKYLKLIENTLPYQPSIHLE